ncbi:MAG: DinB family protein [Anaerolineales bacterium]|nr:DinB family protein [Chloroflexota bacterium]MBL6981933.1 DinB family protein [Anaerolineales bacterium]
MSQNHPLVIQLRFARSSFMLCLEKVTAQDAQVRLKEMNSLSWTIGHLANQENRYWVQSAQNKTIYPKLNDLVGYGKPASTPMLTEMWSTWKMVTTEADRFLDTVTSEKLEEYFMGADKSYPESIGTMLLRNIYHYWYHIGESRTIREMMGHDNLPEYVGNMSQAVYQREKK